MGRAGPARHVFWRAMCANVPGRAGPVKDLGRAVPAQEKKKGGPARLISPWIIRAVPCRAVPVGRANGPWAMIVGSYFFQKILIFK